MKKLYLIGFLLFAVLLAGAFSYKYYTQPRILFASTADDNRLIVGIGTSYSGEEQPLKLIGHFNYVFDGQVKRQDIELNRGTAWNLNESKIIDLSVRNLGGGEFGVTIMENEVVIFESGNISGSEEVQFKKGELF